MNTAQQTTSAGLSEGEFRVRTEFNPSKSGTVDQIKQKAAELINLIESAQPGHELSDKEKQSFGRLKSLGMTAIEEGAMWAVKAATI